MPFPRCSEFGKGGCGAGFEPPTFGFMVNPVALDPLRAIAQKYANYLISLTFISRHGILLCDRLRRISFPLADIVLTEGRAAA
jgi:hypothetical protein